MIDWARVSELKAEVGEEELAEVIEVFSEEIGEALDGLEQGNGTDLKDGLHFVKGSHISNANCIATAPAINMYFLAFKMFLKYRSLPNNPTIYRVSISRTQISSRREPIF